MSKPSVKTRCVANSYAGPNERIIEFSAKAGGGLIAFRETEGAGLVVDVYRVDPPVRVLSPALTYIRTVLAQVRAYDEALNDPIGDGSGRGAKSPDGDSYNEVIEMLQPLYAMLEGGQPDA